MHIRAHTSLPGPLSKLNILTDQAKWSASVTDWESAKELHARFHQLAHSLKQLFLTLTIQQTKQIVRTYKSCAPFFFFSFGTLKTSMSQSTGFKGITFMADGCYTYNFIW